MSFVDLKKAFDYVPCGGHSLSMGLRVLCYKPFSPIWCKSLVHKASSKSDLYWVRVTFPGLPIVINSVYNLYRQMLFVQPWGGRIPALPCEEGVVLLSLCHELQLSLELFTAMYEAAKMRFRSSNPRPWSFVGKVWPALTGLRVKSYQEMWRSQMIGTELWAVKSHLYFFIPLNTFIFCSLTTETMGCEIDRWRESCIALCTLSWSIAVKWELGCKTRLSFS